MKTHLLVYVPRFLFLFLTLVVSTVNAQVAVDNSLYEKILEKYIHQGSVDYRGMKAEEDTLDSYLKILEDTKSNLLSSDEQFAFYINAYNAWTLKLILSNYPGIVSIKDLGSFFQSPWKKKICRIDGNIISLDTLEHEILRPRFKDPRVHFAVNCASKGCPPLSNKPYQGDTLDQQLDEMTIGFINDDGKTFLKGNIIFISPIFKWFKTDFNNNPLEFISKYASGKLKKELKAKNNQLSINYLDYDWTLNGK